MRPKVRTIPNLAETSPLHQEAIRNRADHFGSWHLNVADRFKDQNTDQIKEELRQTAHPFAVCFENWIGDFNMATGIRNANAFNAKEIFYVGDKKWDRRGAVGTYNYTEVQWIPTIDDFKKLKNRYHIVGIDNIPGSSKQCSLRYYHWKPNTLMVFGEEGTGLTPAMQELCEDIVEIEMYGSVRSFNCGVASGIVMHDFINKHYTNRYGDSQWDE